MIVFYFFSLLLYLLRLKLVSEMFPPIFLKKKTFNSSLHNVVMVDVILITVGGS